MRVHKETIGHINDTDLLKLINEWHTMWSNRESGKITNKEYLDWMNHNLTKKGFEGICNSFNGKPISINACLVS
jgi:hypothetical protein